MRRGLEAAREWRKGKKEIRIESGGGVRLIRVLLVKDGGEIQEQEQEAVQDPEGDIDLSLVLGVEQGFVWGQER